MLALLRRERARAAASPLLGPIGPFTFDLQVLHIDAGQVFASSALQVSRQ